MFWKQNNVYLLANVQEKEEIIVKVTDRTQYQLAEESFFTTTGLKFEAVAKQKYTIKIFTKGKIPKLVFMRISETVKTPETAAKKSEMKVTEEKLFFALTKLEVILTSFRALWPTPRLGISSISTSPAMCFTNPLPTLTSRSWNPL